MRLGEASADRSPAVKIAVATVIDGDSIAVSPVRQTSLLSNDFIL